MQTASNDTTTLWMIAALWAVALVGGIWLFLRLRSRERLMRRMYADEQDQTRLDLEDPTAQGFVARWLYLAGYRQRGAAASFVGTTLACAGGGAFLVTFFYGSGIIEQAVFAAEQVPGGIGDLAIPVLQLSPWLVALILVMLPWSLVNSRRKERVRQVEQDLPVTLELLATMSESGLAFDLADPAAIDAAALALLARGGAPDVVVSNAGFTRAETLRGWDADLAAREIEVNLVGAMRFTAALLPAMAARGGGAVVCVSSVNALLHVGNPAYSAAKAGLLAWCRAIAVEHGRAGIRANAVCPGSVRTPAWDHRIEKDPGVVERTARFYPMGRLVEPAEVAAAVLFLASPLAGAITGVALPVDCGLSAGNHGFVETVLGG